MESGIYFKIKTAFSRTKHSGTRYKFSRNNSENTLVRPLSLGSNLDTVFLAGVVFSIGCFLTLFCELLCKNKENLNAYFVSKAMHIMYFARQKTKQVFIKIVNIKHCLFRVFFRYERN